MALAKSLMDAGRDTVIINADASQVYADIPILSAAPTARDMRAVQHKLFGHIDGAETCDAARWAGEAKAEIATAHEQGAIPILVGGTGLYIDTLLHGIAPVPPIPDDLRAAIRALPVGEAWRRLQAADPGAASRLKPLDKTRIARALEVIEATGTPLLAWQRRREGGIEAAISLTPAILLPPRDWLYGRCDARLAWMFDHGAIDEVDRLLARRLDPTLPVMTAIGVPEIAAYWSGELEIDPRGGLAVALAWAQQSTRRFAKRQFTWFRNQPPAAWARYVDELNDVEIDKIVIKLQQTLLT